MSDRNHAPLMNSNAADQSNDRYVGIDIGGTNIVCGVTDSDGQLLGTLKWPTEGDQGGDFLVSRLAEMIAVLFKEQDLVLDRLKSIGIGIPGFLDPMQGIVEFAANLNLRDYPIAKRLGEKLGVPVWIDNDVRMYMFGEYMRGAAAGHDHVLGVAIGTGMSGTSINHGEILYGSRYLAGEIGHAVVEGNSYVCGCGMTGCLETLVSAGGIVRQARDRMASAHSVLAEWFPLEAGQSDKMTAADVARAYDLGDQVAIEVFEYTGYVLGVALSVPLILTSPDIVVIGGGVSRAGERLLAPLRRTLKERTHPLYGEKVIVAGALLIDEAGIIGSAVSAKRRSEQIR